MTTSILPPLLAFYGLFLSACGIVSVIFIGSKARTALISGGASGVIALYTAWLINLKNGYAPWFGIFLAATLFMVFSWRATKTFLRILELIPATTPELRAKGIAFLIIALMAVVSMVTLILQVVVMAANF